jgi:hypothetical protein
LTFFNIIRTTIITTSTIFPLMSTSFKFCSSLFFEITQMVLHQHGQHHGPLWAEISNTFSDFLLHPTNTSHAFGGRSAFPDFSQAH